ELYLFKSKKSDSPTMSISVTPNTVVSRPPKLASSTVEYCFSLYNPEQMPAPISLHVETHGQLQEWLHHLSTATGKPVESFGTPEPSPSFPSSPSSSTSEPPSSQEQQPQFVAPPNAAETLRVMSFATSPSPRGRQQRAVLSATEATVVISVDIQVIETRNVTFTPLPIGVNPLVLVKLLQYECYTSTLSNTTSPSWLESFSFEFTESRAFEEAEVYAFLLQKRLYGSELNQGFCRIPVSTIPPETEHAQWYPLEKSKQRKHMLVTGFLLIELSYVPPIPEIDAAGALSVNLISGHQLASRDRNGNSDPYVIITHAGNTKKSRAKSKTLNPIWDQTFDFSIAQEHVDEPLLFRVFDRDLIGGDDFMGQVVLRLSDVPPRDRYIHRHLLQPVPEPTDEVIGRAATGDEPAIRLKFHVNRLKVFSAERYEKLLSAVVGDPELTLLRTIGSLVSRKDLLAGCVTKIFGSLGQLHSMLATLTRMEIRSTPDSEILFRGNTIATKVMDSVQRLIGQKFLREAIGPIVNTILALQAAVELDPNRMTKKEIAIEAKKGRNLSRLEGFCQLVLDCVICSIQHLPPAIRKSYFILKLEIANTFGSVLDEAGLKRVRGISISSFFFLRLVCPALLTPTLFGLATSPPSEAASRTLTLIAKTLQNLANFVEFGAKEPYMEGLNPFIRRNMDRMHQFLESLSEPPVSSTHMQQLAPPGVKLFSDGDVFLEKEYAQLLCFVRDAWLRVGTEGGTLQIEPALKTLMEDILGGFLPTAPVPVPSTPSLNLAPALI
ncbi:MAG: hypothetical protein Q8P67_01000, partial [archaeon]|nr:hypothetical protein [archaeon]